MAEELSLVNNIDDVKVVVLGDGGAGKTTIITRLIHDGANLDGVDDLKAGGFSVSRWMFPGSDGEQIRVRFWDLGGQAIYHSLHRIFMTKHALYLVVLDARDDSQEERARYWLNTVKTATPDAPVMLVLNKIDQNPNAVLNERALRSEYPNLTEVVRISAMKCSPDEWNAALGDKLLRQIERMRLRIRVPPRSWQSVMEAMEESKLGCINGRMFGGLCDACGIEPEEAVRRSLFTWIGDLGLDCCAVPGDTLEDSWLCRYEWVLDKIFMLLNGRMVNHYNGIVDRQEISRMLRGKGLFSSKRSDTEAEVLLRIMRMCQLSLHLENDLEFVPALCDRVMNPVALAYQTDEECLEFRMEFHRLPDSVMHRLTAYCFASLDRDSVWYSGARFLFREINASALVRSLGNTVIIYVRSGGQNEPMDCLESILRVLEAISAEDRLHIMNQEIIYSRGGLEERYPYDLIKHIKGSQHEELYSKVFGEWIPISRILKQPGAQQQADVQKLVKDIAQACAEVQRHRGNLFAPEEERITALRKHLRVRGQMISDHGVLAPRPDGRLQANQPDLVLLDKDREVRTLIETVTLRDARRIELQDWEKHLNMLLTDASGVNISLPAVFLISFAQCGEKEYSRLWNAYSEHMRWFEPDRMRRREGSHREVLLEPVGDPRIRADCCSYELRGKTITVYHFMVPILQSAGQSKKPLFGERGNAAALKPEIPQLPLADSEAEKRREEPELSHEMRDDPDDQQNAEDLQEAYENQEDPELPGQESEAELPEPEPERTATREEIAGFEYRVVFLGDSEAGKSLLLSRVMDPEKGLKEFEDKTTPGICIKNQFYDIGGSRVRVNYWDFGGQEILHSLHRMFLSVRTLYVIVLNTRNDNHDAQADFWMRYVQAYAYGAPVLFVLNKIDQNSRAKLNMPALNRHFGTRFGEKDVLRISAIEKDHEKFRQEFTEKLLARVAECINFSEAYTPRIAKIRAAVEERKNSGRMIKTDDFRCICEDAGLEDEEAHEKLMERFHQAGILVYFGTDLKMLLDPGWITEAIYLLLKMQDKISVNGFVKRKSLETLCRKELRDSDHAKFVLEVMRYYGLSYQYDDRDPNSKGGEDREFIPMLCQQEEPEIVEDMIQRDNTVEVQMHFEYLPTGVLYQLMVAFRDHLDTDLVWRSGAHFRFGSLVEAIVRRDGNVMQIYMHYHREGGKAKALDHMKEFMDRISIIAERGKSTAKLLETKLGYMVGTHMEYFDYKRLLKAQQSKVHFVASTVMDRRRILVNDILAQEDGQEERTVRKLLKMSLKCCEEMQGNQTYWFRHKAAAADKSAPKMDEDARTQLLKFKLSDVFSVKDQPRWGASATGVKQGELDLKIDTREGESLAILEALNITGDNKASRESWEEHLSRMMNAYNQNGLRHLLLVSYLDCDKDKVKAVQSAYLELLRTYDVPDYGLPQIDPDVLPECPEKIQVVQADYSSDAGDVTVYHFLVHISRYAGQDAAAT